MENLKKQTNAKLNLKELALEKLRKTEGGGTSIGDIIGGTMGMILPNLGKNFK